MFNINTLALFYYTLGNIQPKYRSAIRCIQLFAIVKSSVLQQYGADVILETFMDGIKCLEQVRGICTVCFAHIHVHTCLFQLASTWTCSTQENGVTFTIMGHSYTFRGTLALVSGDNLASHYLGGYKSLSSALRKCRHCMAVADDMATEVYIIIMCTCILYTFVILNNCSIRRNSTTTNWQHVVHIHVHYLTCTCICVHTYMHVHVHLYM